MTLSTATTRRLMHRLAPVLGLLMLVTLFAGGAHHHVDERDHDCVVCTVGHAAVGTEAVATSSTAPEGTGQLLHAPGLSAASPTRVESASSRAPPRS
jgi:hypothetical protein